MGVPGNINCYQRDIKRNGNVHFLACLEGIYCNQVEILTRIKSLLLEFTFEVIDREKSR